MVDDFIVSRDYQGYIFTGWACGQFKDRNGNMRPYANMYVLSPVSDFRSADYQADGYKAEKKSCISSDVWKDIPIGSRVKLFFDDRSRVILAAIDG